MKRFTIKERPIYYFLPAIIVMGILAFYPLINNIELSFTNRSGVLTLLNYKRLFKDRVFWNTCENSFKWLLLTVSMEVVVGVFMAVLLNMKLRGTKLFRTVLMIPWVTPVIAVSALWKWMLNADYGILSTAFNQLFNTRYLFLGDVKTALFWLAFAYAWKRSSFVTLMYLSGLQGISDDVYEACTLDGATWFQQLFYVTLPMLFSVVRSVLLISIISSLNQFTLAYNMTGGGPARSTELIQMYIYNNGIASFNFNFGAAASNVYLLFVIALAMVYVVYTERIEEAMY